MITHGVSNLISLKNISKIMGELIFLFLIEEHYLRFFFSNIFALFFAVVCSAICYTNIVNNRSDLHIFLSWRIHICRKKWGFTFEIWQLSPPALLWVWEFIKCGIFWIALFFLFLTFCTRSRNFNHLPATPHLFLRTLKLNLLRFWNF